MRGDGGDQAKRIADQLRGLGLSESKIQDALKEIGGGAEAAVWPWQELAVAAFLVASTQWRFSGGMSPVRVGMDYSGARIAWEHMGLKLGPVDFEYVQVIESAVLSGGEDVE